MRKMKNVFSAKKQFQSHKSLEQSIKVILRNEKVTIYGFNTHAKWLA